MRKNEYTGVAESARTRVDELKDRIVEWRRTRKRIEPMPSRFWSAAVQLAKTQGTSPIARALAIDCGALNRRLAAATRSADAESGFVEFRLPAPSGVPGVKTVVEVAAADGDRMTIRVDSEIAPDVPSLIRAFRIMAR